MISEYDLTASVNFIGKVNNEDLPFYYSQADATIVPSLYEGLPLVILESLACGTPVAATDVSCHREVVNNDNGILLGDYDPTVLKQNKIAPITYKSTELGSVVVTDSINHPIFVSPGHLISHQTAVSLVIQYSQSRIPEPIRLADQLTRQIKNKNLD